MADTNKEDKKRIIKNLIATVTKEHGELDNIKDFTNGEVIIPNINYTSSGSLILDDTGSCFPLGRIIEIYGANSAGKSTVSMLALINAQKQFPDDIFLYIDVEHSLNLQYYVGMGLDLSRLIFAQPSSAEEALELFEQSASSGAIKGVILDSVASLVSKQQLDKGMTADTMADVARLMSKSMKVIVSGVQKYDVLAIFINQLRDKIGMFVSGQDTSGGKALGYYASVRLEIKKKDTIIVDDKPVGQKIQIVVKKSKVSTPFLVVETDLWFHKGFDFNSELVNLCIEKNIIEKKASWFVYKDAKIQGLDKLKSFFEDNPDKLQILKEEYYNNAKISKE